MPVTARPQPRTALWSPGNSLGQGLRWCVNFDAPGATHRNYVAPGVSDTTVVSGTVGTGELGREVLLNGTTDYARAPLTAAQQLSAPLSWAVLSRTNGSPGTFRYALKCPLPSQNHVWGIGTNGAGQPWAFIRQSGGGYVLAQATTYTWDTRYHLFAATYNAAGALTLYADGIPIASASGDGTLYSYATAGPILLGAVDDSTSTGAFYWAGSLTAAYLWSRALSSQEQLLLSADPFAPIRRRPRVWLGGVMAAVTASVEVAWNILVPVGRSVSLVWDDALVVGTEAALVWDLLGTVQQNCLCRWVVCALNTARERGLVGSLAALPDSGGFIYQDAYNQLYTTSWERQHGLLDFTVVIQQPHVWGEERAGHLGPDGNVYRRGVVTVHRTVLRPLPDGYELVAEGHSQYVDVFRTSFRCAAKPVDPFRHHLGHNVTAECECAVVDGPRWADPAVAADAAVYWGEVDGAGTVSGDTAALAFVDVWAE